MFSLCMEAEAYNPGFWGKVIKVSSVNKNMMSVLHGIC